MKVKVKVVSEAVDDSNAARELSISNGQQTLTEMHAAQATVIESVVEHLKRESSDDHKDSECTICFDDLMTKTGAILQCPQGHTYCCKCYEKIGGAPAKCVVCSVEMGTIRNRFMEKWRNRGDLHQAAQFEAWRRTELWITFGLLVRHEILTEMLRMADFADFAIMDGDADNDQ